MPNRTPIESDARKQGRRLRLEFVAVPDLELHKIEFTFDRGCLPAVCGPGASEEGNRFGWTAVPKAYSLLFLDYASWAGDLHHFKFPNPGEERFAASIEYDRHKNGLAKKLFRRKLKDGVSTEHSHFVLRPKFERGRTKARAIEIKTGFLPQDCVEVFLLEQRGRRKVESEDIRHLAARIRDALKSFSEKHGASKEIEAGPPLELRERGPEWPTPVAEGGKRVEVPSVGGREVIQGVPVVSTEKFDVDFLVARIRQTVGTARSKDQLINGLLAIPINGAKMQFWAAIRALLKKLRITNSDFNKALQRGGMPDDLPLVPDRNLLDYAQQICKRPSLLSRDHQLVWKVAVSVYPPFTSESDPELKAAARYLAYFWHFAVTLTKNSWDFAVATELGRQCPSEENLVYLLSWLELPLVTQTGNVDLGKTGLFEIGRWYQQRAQG